MLGNILLWKHALSPIHYSAERNTMNRLFKTCPFTLLLDFCLTQDKCGFSCSVIYVLIHFTEWMSRNNNTKKSKWIWHVFAKTGCSIWFYLLTAMQSNWIRLLDLKRNLILYIVVSFLLFRTDFLNVPVTPHILTTIFSQSWKQPVEEEVLRPCIQWIVSKVHS